MKKLEPFMYAWDSIELQVGVDGLFGGEGGVWESGEIELEGWGWEEQWLKKGEIGSKFGFGDKWGADWLLVFNCESSETPLRSEYHFSLV
jgi:hypothetical protein